MLLFVSEFCLRYHQVQKHVLLLIFIPLCPLSLLACYCSRVALWKVRASCTVYFGKMNNVAVDLGLSWLSFLGQKFLASGCFLLAGSAQVAAWSWWFSSTRHSINMHNMTGFRGRLLECWFVSSSEWNDVWLWSHQAWTSKARESLPPRSWGCHWLVTMCLCPIDCEMVCCYTAVLHLRPTEVIDWFGHVECSHLVCSNVVFFFLLGGFCWGFFCCFCLFFFPSFLFSPVSPSSANSEHWLGS